MRENFFKAKRIDNGEWVEGDLERTKYDDVIWIVDVRGESVIDAIQTPYASTPDLPTRTTRKSGRMIL